MKVDVNNWEQDKCWTDSYWCQVENEEEFIIACKSLYGKRKVRNIFVVDVFETEECLFDNDLCRWHYLFNTNECDDDEIEEMTHPSEFDGTIDEKLKPDSHDYPLMIHVTVIMDELQMSWHNIKSK